MEEKECRLNHPNVTFERSGIFSSLLPFVKTVAPTIGKTLGLSALAGAASEGASQIIKKNH